MEQEKTYQPTLIKPSTDPGHRTRGQEVQAEALGPVNVLSLLAIWMEAYAIATRCDREAHHGIGIGLEVADKSRTSLKSLPSETHRERAIAITHKIRSSIKTLSVS